MGPPLQDPCPPALPALRACQRHMGSTAPRRLNPGSLAPPPSCHPLSPLKVCEDFIHSAGSMLQDFTTCIRSDRVHNRATQSQASPSRTCMHVVNSSTPCVCAYAGMRRSNSILSAFCYCPLSLAPHPLAKPSFATPAAHPRVATAGTTTSRDVYKQWEVEPRRAPPARPVPESRPFEGESEAHAQFREMALEPRRERPPPAIPVSLPFEGGAVREGVWLGRRWVVGG